MRSINETKWKDTKNNHLLLQGSGQQIKRVKKKIKDKKTHKQEEKPFKVL